jgi:hypothetical protein
MDKDLVVEYPDHVVGMLTFEMLLNCFPGMFYLRALPPTVHQFSTSHINHQPRATRIWILIVLVVSIMVEKCIFAMTEDIEKFCLHICPHMSSFVKDQLNSFII